MCDRASSPYRSVGRAVRHLSHPYSHRVYGHMKSSYLIVPVTACQLRITAWIAQKFQASTQYPMQYPIYCPFAVFLSHQVAYWNRSDRFFSIFNNMVEIWWTIRASKINLFCTLLTTKNGWDTIRTYGTERRNQWTPSCARAHSQLFTLFSAKGSEPFFRPNRKMRSRK